MNAYLAYSIYSYMASFASWRIEKIYKEQKIKIFFVLKHGFRITGTVLLIAHLLS
tara:strand:- start:122 stop:286 length:165 start_codon:yes stop_codon:yes gene_type:complete